jgi:hypothetical protein
LSQITALPFGMRLNVHCPIGAIESTTFIGEHATFTGASVK